MAIEQAEAPPTGRETASPVLEDLISLAAVIGAGCEPCAERMVGRALQHQEAKPFVERSLAILAGVSAAKCFAAAVGQEAVDRMRRSLRAARNALGDASSLRPGDR